MDRNRGHHRRGTGLCGYLPELLVAAAASVGGHRGIRCRNYYPEYHEREILWGARIFPVVHQSYFGDRLYSGGSVPGILRTALTCGGRHR